MHRICVYVYVFPPPLRLHVCIYIYICVPSDCQRRVVIITHDSCCARPYYARTCLQPWLESIGKYSRMCSPHKCLCINVSFLCSLSHALPFPQEVEVVLGDVFVLPWPPVAGIVLCARVAYKCISMRLWLVRDAWFFLIPCRMPCHF